jgi:hypothetical protein
MLRCGKAKPGPIAAGQNQGSTPVVFARHLRYFHGGCKTLFDALRLFVSRPPAALHIHLGFLLINTKCRNELFLVSFRIFA